MALGMKGAPKPDGLSAQGRSISASTAAMLRPGVWVIATRPFCQGRESRENWRGSARPVVTRLSAPALRSFDEEGGL